MFKSDEANWALAFLILLIILGSLGYLGVILHRASARVPSRSDRPSTANAAAPQGRAVRQPLPATRTRTSNGELLKAMLAISTLAIIVGIVLLVKPQSSVDDIRCDGRPMNSSDVCVIYSYGSTVQKSYGQMVSDNTKNREREPIIGGVSLGGGVLVLLVTGLVAAGRAQDSQPKRPPAPSPPASPAPARTQVAPPAGRQPVTRPSEATAKPSAGASPSPPAAAPPSRGRDGMNSNEVRRWLKTGQARRTSTGSLELTAYGTRLLGLAGDRHSGSAASRGADAVRKAEIERQMNDADPTRDDGAGTQPPSSATRIAAIPTYLPDKAELPLSRAKQRVLDYCAYQLCTIENQHGGFLDDAEEWTRSIGKNLNAMGGMDLMRRAHREVVARMPSKTHLARELDVAWDGIGEWRG